jgi:hypothetical protein
MAIIYSNNQQTYLSGTWNSASSYTGLIVDIKDLSSAANSKLFEVRSAGSPRVSIDKTGGLSAVSLSAVTLSAGTYLNLPLASYATTASLANYATTALLVNYATTALYATTASLVNYETTAYARSNYATTGAFVATGVLLNYETTAYARANYDTTAYARANYVTTAAGRFNDISGLNFSSVNLSATNYLNLPASARVGGATTQVQYNNGGVFSGSPNMTFNGTTLSLNAAAGGIAANYLQDATQGAAIRMAEGVYSIGVFPDALVGNGRIGFFGNVDITGANRWLFTPNLSATTLSATNYLNLPLTPYALTASLANYETTAYARANYATTALYATTASLANYATTALYATTASLANYETTAYARANYVTTGMSWSSIFKTSDETKSANSLTLDNTLKFAVASGKIYTYHGKVMYYATTPARMGGAKGGFNFGLSSVLGTALVYYWDLTEQALATGVTMLTETGGGATGNKSWIGITNADADGYGTIHFDGLIDNTAGAAGQFSFNWSPEDNGTNAIVKAGSYVELKLLN